MPETNKETKNYLSLKKHVKRLKEEVHQSLEVTLGGNIEDWIDVKTLTPKIEMAEQQAEENVVKGIPLYLKAKTIGENFAREITD